MTHKTIISTIPGSIDTKFVEVELSDTDACRDCGEFPRYGLWAICWRCQQPVCDRCAIQYQDGHFCKSCFGRQEE